MIAQPIQAAGPAPPVCAACGAHHLSQRFRVASDPGETGLIPTTDRFGAALDDIVRCRGCGHLQLAGPAAVELLSDGYERARCTDYLNEEVGQRATARRTLAMITRHTAPGALLDIGCWLGFLLDEARRAGWRGVGVEPSRFASGYARQQLGLDVRTGGLFDVELPPAAFDAVVLADVLEHLPDPGAALERVRILTRPGGVLFLALPDAGSLVARALGRRWWSVIPTHVQYFTRHSLAVLLNRSGWETLALTTSPKAFTLGYYLGRIGGYSRPLAGWLSAASRRAGVAERLVAPDFGDRMAVVARASGPPLE
ncbi:MAG: class I SAM-dependent methyltransferase [Actinomycetota bacterium]|nr:class I SAM-dependent methyltransferase [Actinomycetota bacterium]